ncbi:MAG: glycerophosphodiester phosphodiesterase family protein [Planctomycetota bacterium]
MKKGSNNNSSMIRILFICILGALLHGRSWAQAELPLPMEYEQYVRYLINRNVDALSAYPYSSLVTYESESLMSEVNELFIKIRKINAPPWTCLHDGLGRLWHGLPSLGPDLPEREWHQAVLDRFLVISAFELLDPAGMTEMKQVLFQSLVNKKRHELIRFFTHVDHHPLAAFEATEHAFFYDHRQSNAHPSSPAPSSAETSRILAHCGGFCPHPENSLSAFRHAVASGADGFECDLRLSADPLVFIAHDDVLERLTGKRARLRELGREEVSTLVLRNPYPGNTERDESPVLLNSVLKELGKKTQLWLELKPGEALLLADKTGDLLEKFDLIDKVIVSSFSHEMIKPLRARFPTLKVAYEYAEITESDMAAFLKAPDKNRLIISVDHFAWAAPDILKKVQQAGIETSSFTLNRFDALRTALKKGITYIQTDRPDRAGFLRQILSSTREAPAGKKAS